MPYLPPVYSSPHNLCSENSFHSKGINWVGHTHHWEAAGLNEWWNDLWKTELWSQLETVPQKKWDSDFRSHHTVSPIKSNVWIKMWQWQWLILQCHLITSSLSSLPGNLGFCKFRKQAQGENAFYQVMQHWLHEGRETATRLFWILYTMKAKGETGTILLDRVVDASFKEEVCLFLCGRGKRTVWVKDIFLVPPILRVREKWQQPKIKHKASEDLGLSQLVWVSSPGNGSFAAEVLAEGTGNTEWSEEKAWISITVSLDKNCRNQGHGVLVNLLLVCSMRCFAYTNHGLCLTPLCSSGSLSLFP